MEIKVIILITFSQSELFKLAIFDQVNATRISKLLGNGLQIEFHIDQNDLGHIFESIQATKKTLFFSSPQKRGRFKENRRCKEFLNYLQAAPMAGGLSTKKKNNT